nr:hypothetical protein [Saccharomonospora sp.]
MSWRRVLTGAAVAVVVIAAMFAVRGVLAWISAAGDEDLDTAKARDEALRAGRQHVAELTTMDHEDVEGGLRRWLDVATGPLRSELEDTEPATLSAVEQAGTVATGTVLTAGLSEFNAEAGTATLLASVEVTTARESADPVFARNRYRAQLRHTDDGWKVASFEPIPTGGAS